MQRKIAGWWRAFAPSLGLAVLVAALSFQSGGFFPWATGIAALALAVTLALRASVVDRPFAGLSRSGAVASAALGLFALLVLLSATWSHAPARAVLESDRALVYALAVLVAASLTPRAERLQVLLWGLFAVTVTVCTAGLVTRVLPGVFPPERTIQQQRLSQPLTYWNALGVMTAGGLVLGVHIALTAGRVWARALGAAALPLLACTLYFTFSRAGIALGVVGPIVYLALARTPGRVALVCAGVPAVFVCLLVAYDADVLATAQPFGHTAERQGLGVFGAVVACCLAAGLLQAAFLLPGAWRQRVTSGRDAVASALLRLLPAPWRHGVTSRDPRVRRRLTIAATAIVGLVVVAAVASRADHEVNRFLHGSQIQVADQRSRLFNPGNNGRLDQWRVSLDDFRDAPLHGTGAGTYQLAWERDRPQDYQVVDAHSLYIEQLGELGLPGLALVLTFVGALGWGVLRAFRRTRAPAEAAALTLFGLWIVHAGVDWDWEMPAVTLGPFFAAAVAGAATLEDPPGRRILGAVWSRALDTRVRLAIGLGCLVLAVDPARGAFSQTALDRAVTAYRQGRCGAAIDGALDSRQWLARPEQAQILALCDIRLGQRDLALRQAKAATDVDPGNSEMWFTRALVEAVYGVDPRPAARRALALNPLSGQIQLAAAAFAKSSKPAGWRKAVRAFRINI